MQLIQSVGRSWLPLLVSTNTDLAYRRMGPPSTRIASGWVIKRSLNSGHSAYDADDEDGTKNELNADDEYDADDELDENS